MTQRYLSQPPQRLLLQWHRPPAPTCPEMRRMFLLRWCAWLDAIMALCCPRGLETVITTRQYHRKAKCETKKLNKATKQQMLSSL